MRYSDFRIVEAKLDEIPDDGNRGEQEFEGLKKGPPYPQEEREAVSQLQAKLEELYYSVGNTGVDGKYGPRTARAVSAYRRDRNLADTNRGAQITSQEIQQLMGAERTENITATGNRYEFNPQTGEREGSNLSAGDPNAPVPGYPDDINRREIEEIIRQEAQLRNIDPDVAVRIFRAEGASNYQSTVPRTGRGSHGGREASFGPYQLFIGGGLGNIYQRETGRNLLTDNTREGIINQIRFALDMAVENTWQPWYGRIPARVAKRQGLEGAEQVRNWS
jgi:peptidoglycan hydrolase-like protein with peptidoglycan-binding domain